MASNPIKIKTVLSALLPIVAVECLAWGVFRLFHPPALAVMAGARLLQITIMAWVFISSTGSLDAIGLSASTARNGIFKGLLWSGAFGAAAALGMLIVSITGQNPLLGLRSPLPSESAGLIGFFVVGAFIAPLAEEICFRGILYTYFRRWGIPLALIASTLVFVLLHSVRGVPLVQIAGGIVFALAYETSRRNLFVPIVIHMLGNLALFTLSLPFFA